MLRVCLVSARVAVCSRGESATLNGVLAQHRRRSSSDETKFHTMADETLESILNSAIALEEKHDDLETELASGVLTIKFERSNKSWVINKQTPNRQIWVSSPLSGPARFELEEGIWRHTRDFTRLSQLLRAELDLDYDEQ